MRFRLTPKDFLELSHLNRASRLLHPIALRHAVGVGLGVCLAVSGSWIAKNCEHFGLIPHIVWDAVAYTVHAFGCVPILHHIEPLWAILIGDD